MKKSLTYLDGSDKLQVLQVYISFISPKREFWSTFFAFFFFAFLEFWSTPTYKCS